MKKLVYVLSIILTFLFVSCTSELSDEIKSGQTNACKHKKALEQLKLDPTNQELIEEVARCQRYVESNRSSEDDKEAFDEAVKKHLEEECK